MQTLAGIIESKSNLFDHKNEKTNFRKPKKMCTNRVQVLAKISG